MIIISKANKQQIMNYVVVCIVLLCLDVPMEHGRGVLHVTNAGSQHRVY